MSSGLPIGHGPVDIRGHEAVMCCSVTQHYLSVIGVPVGTYNVGVTGLLQLWPGVMPSIPAAGLS